jgi:quercetin dioxygenase-like cupin family protein
MKSILQTVTKILRKQELVYVDLPYKYLGNLIDEMTEIPGDSIVSKTIYQDDSLKAILFGFAEGQELSEHTASMPAVIQIISGECRLTLGSDVKEAQAGTWVHMEARLPHSLYAKSPVVMLLLLLK